MCLDGLLHIGVRKRISGHIIYPNILVKKSWTSGIALETTVWPELNWVYRVLASDDGVYSMESNISQPNGTARAGFCRSPQ